MNQENVKFLRDIIHEGLMDNVDGKRLLSYLRIKSAIDENEEHEVGSLVPKDRIRRLCTVIMVMKEDKDMETFIESFKDAGYTGVYQKLKEKFPDGAVSVVRGGDRLKRLKRVFQSNPHITPDLYLSWLIIHDVLTHDDEDYINSKISRTDKNNELIKRLALKDDEQLKMLKTKAIENKHVDFAAALTREGF